MLDYKHKDITAKYQDERITSSMYRIYSCHFAGSAHFHFTKAGGRKMDLGSEGYLARPEIIMSSFYLPNEIFFSPKLRRHSETSLHHGVSPLANANVW